MPELSAEPVEAEAVKDLLTKVPRPPEEDLPEGVGDADIEAFAERTGITLPRSLAAWLKTSNGPCVGPGGIFGIRPAREDLDIEFRLGLHPRWRERAWIPVAGDGCGNCYVLATAQEFGPGWPILFVDIKESPDRPAYIVASDIWHFLAFLLEDEFLHAKGIHDTPWPFDRAEVTRRDPGIESFKGVAMPWDAD